MLVVILHTNKPEYPCSEAVRASKEEFRLAVFQIECLTETVQQSSDRMKGIIIDGMDVSCVGISYYIRA